MREDHPDKQKAEKKDLSTQRSQELNSAKEILLAGINSKEISTSHPHCSQPTSSSMFDIINRAYEAKKENSFVFPFSRWPNTTSDESNRSDITLCLTFTSPEDIDRDYTFTFPKETLCRKCFFVTGPRFCHKCFGSAMLQGRTCVSCVRGVYSTCRDCHGRIVIVQNVAHTITRRQMQESAEFFIDDGGHEYCYNREIFSRRLRVYTKYDFYVKSWGLEMDGVFEREYTLSLVEYLSGSKIHIQGPGGSTLTVPTRHTLYPAIIYVGNWHGRDLRVVLHLRLPSPYGKLIVKLEQSITNDILEENDKESVVFKSVNE